MSSVRAGDIIGLVRDQSNLAPIAGDQVLDCFDACPGVDDAVFGDCGEAIPATSVWGLLVVVLLLLTIGIRRG